MQAPRLVTSGWVQCREVQQVKQVRSPTPLTGNAQSPLNRPSPCSTLSPCTVVEFYARDALVLQTKFKMGLLPVARPSSPGSLATVSTLLLVDLLAWTAACGGWRLVTGSKQRGGQRTTKRCDGREKRGSARVKAVQMVPDDGYRYRLAGQ